MLEEQNKVLDMVGVKVGSDAKKEEPEKQP